MKLQHGQCLQFYQTCVITYAHCLIPTGQRNMAYSSKWEMTVFEIQTRDIHILLPPPILVRPTLHQTYAWVCLISRCIFRSLLLYFCTEFSWQYNAMHKFVRALDNPPPIQGQTSQVLRFWGWSHGLTMRHKNLTVNRFTSRCDILIHFIFFSFLPCKIDS